MCLKLNLHRAREETFWRQTHRRFPHQHKQAVQILHVNLHWRNRWSTSSEKLPHKGQATSELAGMIPLLRRRILVAILCCKTSQLKHSILGGAQPFQTKDSTGSELPVGVSNTFRRDLTENWKFFSSNQTIWSLVLISIVIEFSKFVRSSNRGFSRSKSFLLNWK